MNKRFDVVDKEGYRWGIILPVTMGYEDAPLVRIEGRGSYQMPEKALEELAIALLRSYGYVVIAPQDVKLADDRSRSHAESRGREGHSGHSGRVQCG